jgi:hypothetical protein
MHTVSKQLPRLLSTITEDDVYVRHVRVNERMHKKAVEKSEKYGRPIGKVTVVFDLKGLPVFPTAAGMRIVRRHTATDEAFYAESLKHLVIINAPIYFTAIWAIVKPWLDANTLEKIRIFGSNYIDGLKAVMAEDQIPAEYGGTKQDFHWSYPANFE